MKKIITNEVHGEGYLYEYKLEERHSDKNDTDFISGKVSLATNEECSNVVDFHFIYVTPKYSKSGKDNPNYKLLKTIIDSGETKTVMGAGKENALKLKIDGKINVNDFVSKDNPDEIISQVRNEVSFINVTPNFTPDNAKRSYFKTDMIITGAFRKDADEEKNVKEHLVISGAALNDYTKALIPVKYNVYNPDAIAYFESLEPSTSTPVFTKVWGTIANQEFVSKIETKSAFGADLVEERTTTRKEYVITGALSEIYEWDSEEGILASELRELMSNRELHLAEVKKNYEEYQKTKNSETSVPEVKAADDFKF